MRLRPSVLAPGCNRYHRQIWPIVLPTIPVITVLCCGLGVLALVLRWRSLRGTTLRAPLVWAAVALVAIAAAESAIAWLAVSQTFAVHLRYLAAVCTFCPLMALLGAKRPQDRGWQWVVATLVLVAALPSLNTMAFFPASPIELHGFVRWFLVLPLWGLGLANHLPTRLWPASLLASGGQLWLLAPQMPEFAWLLPPGLGSDLRVATAAAALAMAATLWAVAWPARRPAAQPLSQLWLDFRDGFGTVWGLRIALRFQATAKICHWPQSLTWQGLPAEESLPPETHLAMEQALRTLLRRFVSDDWIAARLSPP